MTDAQLEPAAALVARCLPCRCHDGFTSRDLIDPACPRHNYADEIVEAIRDRDLAAAALALREGAKLLEQPGPSTLVKPSKEERFAWALSRAACRAELCVLADAKEKGL